MINTTYCICLFYDKVNFALKVTIFLHQSPKQHNSDTDMTADGYAEHRYIPGTPHLAPI